jgi:taurine transport system substrate-binding protein
MHDLKKRFFKTAALILGGIALISSAGYSLAQQKEVTIAYIPIVGPFSAAIANGDFEKGTGYKINWRQFDSGAKVAAAMASGDIKLGVIGSSPVTAACTRGVGIQLFWIHGDIDDAEALVVRNGSGINGPADLKGKKLGTPFVSTAHYHAMFALEVLGLAPNSVQMLNMSPPQIAAAWERGDIDAAYVWDPALARIKKTGKVMIASGELNRRGKVIFDGVAVDQKWGEANAEFMARFVKVAADSDSAYRNNPQAWTPDSGPVKANVRLLGADAQEVGPGVALYRYPTLAEQASPTWLGGGSNGGAAKAMRATADFLKERGSIDTVLNDYGNCVTSKYAEAAMKLK